MSVLDSLLVDGFGLGLVFVVLIALSIIIKLITIVVGGVKKEKKITEEQVQQEIAVPKPAVKELPYADGELRLYDVDEKTAALIMAIVSDESKIPLSQLQFKSIRLIKQEV